ncbi:MAG: ABC transporter substrate-binding protein, partial [Chloroflexota bacterium]
AHLLSQAHMTVHDVDAVPLPFPEMITALANKSIDAAQLLEPFLTEVVDKGVAVRYKPSGGPTVNMQIGAILFSPRLAGNRDLGTRFMVAYLKGVRLYNDAFDKDDPRARREVVDILVARTRLKNKALYQRMVTPGLDPNGAVSLAGLKAQEDYYLSAGEQQKPVDLQRLLDPSFARAAVKVLGPY